MPLAVDPSDGNLGQSGLLGYYATAFNDVYRCAVDASRSTGARASTKQRTLNACGEGRVAVFAIFALDLHGPDSSNFGFRPELS